jgi:hypothetical protein
MLSVIMLSVVMLNVIMLSVVMMSAIMLSVVMLSVVAPFCTPLQWVTTVANYKKKFQCNLRPYRHPY